MHDGEIVDPAEGFGQLWSKHFAVTLTSAAMTPQALIAYWRTNFGDFWPAGNRFYEPLVGIEPNVMARSDLEMPAGTTLSTGIIVTDVTPISFTFKTPKGHTFAGWVTFSADEDHDTLTAKVDIVMRASDPVFELGLALGGHRREESFWHETLSNLARSLGSQATPTAKRTLVDRHRHWTNAANIRNNGLLHSALARVRTLATRPLRRTPSGDSSTS